MFPWHQYLFAILFIIGGFFHLQKPKLYIKITPSYIPQKKTVVLVTGIMEMVLGLMLITKETQSVAAWSIILLLILFLPVHFYMLKHKEASLKLPKWILFVRIPLQFGLIYWAFSYT